MKKTIKITLIVFACIFLVIAGSMAYYMNSTKTRTAFLKVESGEVQVHDGKSWIYAIDGMKLGINDKVKTMDGKARIILFESIIISLNSNTEVLLKEISEEKVVIFQSSGSTWNKFTPLYDINTFEIQTPKILVFAEGTEFGVTMDEVTVAEGSVYVGLKDSTEKLEIVAGWKAVILENGEIVKEKIGGEEIEIITKNMEKTLDDIKDIRFEEINKHKLVYDQAKKKYNFTDEDAKILLNNIDNGLLDDRELIAQSPIQIDFIDKLIALNDQIKDQQEAIDKFEELI